MFNAEYGTSTDETGSAAFVLRERLSVQIFVLRTSGRCVSIDARETAPAAAFETMYVNDTTQSSIG